MAKEDNLIPFKPGQSGNPKGYPKGIPNTATRMKRLLQLTQNLNNPITGELEGFTVLEQIDMKIMQSALKGDLRAAQEVLNRLEGRPKESIDHTTGGEKIQFVNDVPRAKD